MAHQSSATVVGFVGLKRIPIVLHSIKLCRWHLHATELQPWESLRIVQTALRRFLCKKQGEASKAHTVSVIDL